MTPIVAALLIVVAAAAPTQAADPAVRIGMRADAPPFSYLDDEKGAYAGFLVSLCIEAAHRAGRAAEPEPITAANRFEPGLELDVVCDPTTITRDRVRAMDFSPIVFIANGGFVQRPGGAPVEASADLRERMVCAGEPDPTLPVTGVGLLGDTTARAAYSLAARSGLLRVREGSVLCILEVGDHKEGIDHLCAGALDFYFGDIDIMRSHLARRPGCEATLHPSFRTYEPYALALPTADEGFRRSFVAALYELFADDGEAGALAIYKRHFADIKMSPALETLFRMNRIPAGIEHAD